MESKKHAFGLYLHWPYCISKCPYCDFASSVCKQIDEDIILNGYKRDLFVFKEKFQQIPSITSIFFGGGTPSLMSEKLFDKIINHIAKNFSIQSNAEISLEANPDTISIEKMKNFYQSGLNRLSIGIQSLNEKDLKFLGRTHNVQKALQTIENAKSIFSRINIDLIYARPRQSVKNWEKELCFALNLGLNHYSLYQLTLEEGTPFFKNNIPQISDLQAKRLYILTEEITKSYKIFPYEISNYAKKGNECRHNLIYWRGQNYLGIGPASHGRMDFIAIENDKSVHKWLINGPQFSTLSSKEKQEEKLLMELRLIKEGYPIKNLNPISIQNALKKGWINLKNNKIYTTLQGRIMLNQLILLLTD